MNILSSTVALALLSAISVTAFAADNNYDEEHRDSVKTSWYIGLDYIHSDGELDIDSRSVLEDYDYGTASGFGATIGLDFRFSKSFSLATELEYQQFGDTEYTRPYDDVKVDQSASTFGINVLPKWYVAGGNFYLAGIVGLISVNDELDLDNGLSYDVTESTIQYGAELGYEFEAGPTLSIGYRSFSADTFVNASTDYQTINVGIGFKF